MDFLSHIEIVGYCPNCDYYIVINREGYPEDIYDIVEEEYECCSCKWKGKIIELKNLSFDIFY